MEMGLPDAPTGSRTGSVGKRVIPPPPEKSGRGFKSRRGYSWSCGAAWSAHFPVKEKDAGSNPVRTAGFGGRFHGVRDHKSLPMGQGVRHCELRPPTFSGRRREGGPCPAISQGASRLINLESRFKRIRIEEDQWKREKGFVAGVRSAKSSERWESKSSGPSIPTIKMSMTSSGIAGCILTVPTRSPWTSDHFAPSGANLAL